jgi:hypothetical protein
MAARRLRPSWWKDKHRWQPSEEDARHALQHLVGAAVELHFWMREAGFEIPAHLEQEWARLNFRPEP